MSLAEGQPGLGLVESLSVQGWVKAESVGEEMVLLSFGDAQRKEAAYELFIDAQGKVNFSQSEDGDFSPASAQNLRVQKGLTRTQWDHLGAVFDAAVQRMAIYIDGHLIEQKTVKFKELYGSSGPFLLGVRLKNGGMSDHFEG